MALLEMRCACFERWHGVCLHLATVEPARDNSESSRLPHAVVVEGDVALRILLERTLERSGFKVDSWADDSALERGLDRKDGEAESAQLLVADVDTPGGASPATLMRLRERMPQLLIVLVGALGDASLERLARRIGARRVLEKPFDFAQLSRLARGFVAGGAVSRRTEMESTDSTQGAA